jgi:exonuclease SbcC
MRIHSLRFAALGPFAGEEVIDFDALGPSALFLIDGPTGAGKSTIIDAIVFALYGDRPSLPRKRSPSPSWISPQ